MPTSICSFIAAKHAPAPAPPAIVYNPFDDDAVVNYFLVFRKELRKAERKAAMDAAITYLLNKGLRPNVVVDRLKVYWNAVSVIRARLAPTLPPPPVVVEKITRGIARREDDGMYVGGAKHSMKSGNTPMSFDLAERIRADPITNQYEIARKYKVSNTMARTIKLTNSWTRPAAAV
jgi:hypothetical protein